jgi:cytochrome c biogenesis protein CcmG/thiol:disulfide interchange protein DsbE
MFCAKCGARNEDDARFCIKCGSQLLPIVKPRGMPRERGPRRLWRSALAGGVAVTVLAASALGCIIHQRSRPPGGETSVRPAETGRGTPDLELTALDGSLIDVDAQRGKVVVLNFFASWCSPCHQEATELEQAWRDYRDRGVQFYGIAYKDADSKARGFLEEFGITYPCALDLENVWSRRYGVTGIPETFVLDQQGQLVEHIIGPTSAADLGRVLDQLVGP